MLIGRTCARRVPTAVSIHPRPDLPSSEHSPCAGRGGGEVSAPSLPSLHRRHCPSHGANLVAPVAAAARSRLLPPSLSPRPALSGSGGGRFVSRRWARASERRAAVVAAAPALAVRRSPPQGPQSADVLVAAAPREWADAPRPATDAGAGHTERARHNTTSTTTGKAQLQCPGLRRYEGRECPQEMR